jgi:xanthine dehydrogenase YagT iron-sulfur-binding subunit
MTKPEDSLELSRREFVGAAVAGGMALTIAPAASALAEDASPPAGPVVGDLPVKLTVNKTEHALSLDPRATLLDTLRESLDLTGAKKGCDHGQCGACTVHVDGRRVASCLTLAVTCEGKSITTIEGLAEGEKLHPMQEAFIKHDALQCGYCTPGQIMSATALVAEGHAKNCDQVKELMSGNLCRCGAYNNICAAVCEVAGIKM